MKLRHDEEAGVLLVEPDEPPPPPPDETAELTALPDPEPSGGSGIIILGNGGLVKWRFEGWRRD